MKNYVKQIHCVHCYYGTVDDKNQKGSTALHPYLFFKCTYVLSIRTPGYILNATTRQRQFHLLCLNAFINASQTHY